MGLSIVMESQSCKTASGEMKKEKLLKTRARQDLEAVILFLARSPWNYCRNYANHYFLERSYLNRLHFVLRVLLSAPILRNWNVVGHLHSRSKIIGFFEAVSLYLPTNKSRPHKHVGSYMVNVNSTKEKKNNTKSRGG